MAEDSGTAAPMTAERERLAQALTAHRNRYWYESAEGGDYWAGISEGIRIAIKGIVTGMPGYELTSTASEHTP